MFCAACHRYISKPSALSNGMPVGPVCAIRLGLSRPRQKPVGISLPRVPGQPRLHAPVVLPGQLPLFVEVAA